MCDENKVIPPCVSILIKGRSTVKPAGEREARLPNQPTPTAQLVCDYNKSMQNLEFALVSNAWVERVSLSTRDCMNLPAVGAELNNSSVFCRNIKTIIKCNYSIITHLHTTPAACVDARRVAQDTLDMLVDCVST